MSTVYAHRGYVLTLTDEGQYLVHDEGGVLIWRDQSDYMTVAQLAIDCYTTQGLTAPGNGTTESFLDVMKDELVTVLRNTPSYLDMYLHDKQGTKLANGFYMVEPQRNNGMCVGMLAAYIKDRDFYSNLVASLQASPNAMQAMLE